MVANLARVANVSWVTNHAGVANLAGVAKLAGEACAVVAILAGVAKLAGGVSAVVATLAGGENREELANFVRFETPLTFAAPVDTFYPLFAPPKCPLILLLESIN